MSGETNTSSFPTSRNRHSTLATLFCLPENNLSKQLTNFSFKKKLQSDEGLFEESTFTFPRVSRQAADDKTFLARADP